MSEAHTPTLADALSHEQEQNKELRDRLRASESEAGKVGALQRENENLSTKVDAQRKEIDSLKSTIADKESRVSELESEAHAATDDAEQIDALEKRVKELEEEKEGVRAEFERQAQEYNTLSTAHVDLQEQLRKAQGAESMARKFKEVMEFVENVE